MKQTCTIKSLNTPTVLFIIIALYSSHRGCRTLNLSPVWESVGILAWSCQGDKAKYKRKKFREHHVENGVDNVKYTFMQKYFTVTSEKILLWTLLTLMINIVIKKLSAIQTLYNVYFTVISGSILAWTLLTLLINNVIIFL